MTVSAPRFASLLQPLDDIVPADQLAQFHELAVEGSRVDGKLYWCPSPSRPSGSTTTRRDSEPADDDG